MKHTLQRFLGLALLSLAAPTLLAQEVLNISAADSARMGIVFAPVALADNNAGARFPATVINSPDAVALLSATHAGRILQWHRVAGETLQAGDLLLTMSSQDILPLQQDWIQAVTALESAEFSLQKDQSLFEQGVISQQRLTQTRSLQEQALFGERGARAQLTLAGFTAQRLQQLRTTGAGLGQYYVLAPGAAVMTQRMAGAGEFVAAGSALVTLNAGDSRWLSVHLPARLAADVDIGQRISIADSGQSLTIRQKDFAVDRADQSIEILAEFDAAASFMTGQILTVNLPSSRQGILIPDRAVVHTGQDTTVYVRTAAGVEARNLNLRSLGADYLAESGIREGEQIAIQGTAVLKGIQLGLGGGE